MFESKNIFYKNLLSRDACEEIKISFLKTIEQPFFKNLDNLTLTPNSTGCMNLPETLKYKDKILEIIRKDYQKENWNIEFENSYIRIYKKNSCLNMHTDRPELDITLTLNIDGIQDWALCISNVMYETWRADYSWDDYTDLTKYEKDYNTYITPRGCGVASYGKSYPHWRYPLVCKDDEYVIQLFYHWSYWKPAELA